MNIEIAQIVKQGALWIFQGRASVEGEDDIVFNQIGGSKAGALQLGELWLGGLGNKYKVDTSEVQIIEPGVVVEELDVDEVLADNKEVEDVELDPDTDDMESVVEELVAEEAEELEEVEEIETVEAAPVIPIDAGEVADVENSVEDFLALDSEQASEKSELDQFGFDVEGEESVSPALENVDSNTPSEIVDTKVDAMIYPEAKFEVIRANDEISLDNGEGGFNVIAVYDGEIIQDYNKNTVSVSIEVQESELTDLRLFRSDGNSKKSVKATPGKTLNKTWKAPENESGMFEFWFEVAK